MTIERLRHALRPFARLADDFEAVGTGVYVKFVAGRVRDGAEFIPTPRKKKPRTMPDKRGAALTSQKQETP